MGRRNAGFLRGKRLRVGWVLLLGLGVALAPPAGSVEPDPRTCRTSAAQAVSTPTWAALYGGDGAEEMEGVWPTSDGGFLVAGSTDSFGVGVGDAWLVKLNASGAVEWQKTYGGSRDEYALDVRETSDGGYIVAGWTDSFGAGQADFWVLKLDPTGGIEWEYTYGGPGIEQAWSVVPTSDGGYLVAGGTTSFGAGGADFWALKLDAQGEILWQKTYGGPADDGGGGEFEELTVKALEDADGNYVLASETFSFGHGASDLWVLKLDPQGNVLWERAYGGADEETLWWFLESTQGGYIVPGVTVSFSPDGSGDLWVLRLDTQGNILWQRVYGVPGYWDEALSAGAASDGGALIGGYYEEGTQDWDLFLLRLDADGTLLWQKVWEYGWDWPNAVQPLGDGGFIVAGVAWPRPQDLELLMLRLPADGSLGPSCENLTDFSLVPQDTTSTPLTTNAAVQETNVTPQPSSATVQDTSVVPNYLCQAESGTTAAFRVTSQGDVYADGAFYCGLSNGCFNVGIAADVAEYVFVSEPVEPGDVVELDPDRPGSYRKARGPYSPRVAGVIAAQPGITLATHLRPSASAGIGTTTETGTGTAPLALLGRVYVKTTTEGGPIRPGDLLTTATKPGYAMRCPDPSRCEGSWVGKALTSLTQKEGIVEVLLMP